jgi:hypothetical protein
MNCISSQQKSILKLVFPGSKKSVQNRLKLQFVKLDFSEIKSRTDQQGVWSKTKQ